MIKLTINMGITTVSPSSLGYAGASGPLWVDSDTKNCSGLETANVVILISLILLQIWRMIDFIYRPEEEVLAELEEVRPQLLAENAPGR